MISKYENENINSQANQKEDSNKEYIDMDEAEEFCLFEKMARTRFHRVPDWKIQDLSLIEAYKTSQMRPNDRKFLNSIFFGTLSYLIMTVCVMIDMKSLKGIIIVLPALYVAVCFLIGSSVIYQSRQFRKTELVFWVVFNLLYLILGLVYISMTLSPD